MEKKKKSLFRVLVVFYDTEVLPRTALVLRGNVKPLKREVLRLFATSPQKAKRAAISAILSKNHPCSLRRLCSESLVVDIKKPKRVAAKKPKRPPLVRNKGK